MKNVNLIVIGFLLLLSVQCAQKEEEIAPTDQASTALLEELESLPSVVDPDPVIEEPDYDEIFSPNLSIEVLKGMAMVAEGNEIPLPILEILKSIEDNTKAIDPSIQALLADVDIEFLMGVMNPDSPLDPQLEEFLKQMLEIEKINLPLPILPELNSKAVEESGERKSDLKMGIGSEQSRTTEPSGPCVEEVYTEYGSGFRICNLGYEDDVFEIDANYIRRLEEAEVRLAQRNILIKELFTQNLPQLAIISQEIKKLVNNLRNHEIVKENREQLSYFSLIYSYFIRMNFATLYNYAFVVNQLYYDHEVKLITDLREEKLEEAETNRQACLARVEEIIQKEIKRRCPYQEPEN